MIFRVFKPFDYKIHPKTKTQHTQNPTHGFGRSAYSEPFLGRCGGRHPPEFFPSSEHEFTARQEMSSTDRKPLGRPRCQISGQQVMELRDRGLSWRHIASKLAVSPATAIRALRAYQNSGKACQNLAVPGLDYPWPWDD